MEYYTNVKIGKEIIKSMKNVDTFNERFIGQQLNDFLESDFNDVRNSYYPKICALYGLRRTGKTTMMLQEIKKFNEKRLSKTAWIQVNTGNIMSSIYLDIKQLLDKGIQYVFIDEITKAEDFMQVSALLSDDYARSGMHITISGTDSLGILFARRSELFDRMVTIHTTYIPYYEFKYLFPEATVNDYIEKGGLLSESGINYNQEENIKEYLDSAIVQNVQHSLKYLEKERTLGPLHKVYMQNELTNLINRVIEDKNHEFILDVFTRDFESHDFGSMRDLVSQIKGNQQLMNFAHNLDMNQITLDFRNKLEILNKNELKEPISENIVSSIEYYLDELDFFADIHYIYASKTIGQEDKSTLVQPAIRYNQAKEALRVLMNESNYNLLSSDDREEVNRKLLTDIKGRMLEEIVLLQTQRALGSDSLVAQLQFHMYKNSPFTTGEYDMIIKDGNGTSIFEIKNNEKVDYVKQTKHLLNPQKNQWMEEHLFHIRKRIVLYNGKSLPEDENGVTYINVGEYLDNLKQYDKNYLRMIEKEKENKSLIVENSKKNENNKTSNLYLLKKYDQTLMRFSLRLNEYGEPMCSHVEIVGELQDFPEKVTAESESVLKWLKSRIIPRNREFVHEILSNQGLSYDDLEGILNVCLGLSVNDVYWVVPEQFQGKFKDYNLYENSFSNALGLVAFTGYSQTIQELSPSPEMTTNGQLPKAWRRIDNQLILYKGGTDSSFANGGNEPYSEYYAAQVAEAMGIDHVNYDLEQWKGILASTCQNFTDIEHSYVPIGKLMGSAFTMDGLYSLVKQLAIQPAFSDMILLDAVLLNEDRHLGNFGLLKNNHTNQYERMAPLFDHGISLLSHFPEKDIENDYAYKDYVKQHKLSAFDISHDKLVKLFCSKKDIKKLAKLYDFKFKKHSKYNVSDDRLHRMEMLVQERARGLARLLVSGEQNLKMAQEEQREDPIVQNSFLNYDYEYIGDDWQGEYKIYKGEKLIAEGEIKPEDVQDVDPIQWIETQIEKMFYSKEITRD